MGRLLGSGPTEKTADPSCNAKDLCGLQNENSDTKILAHLYLGELSLVSDVAHQTTYMAAQ
jgi:hypothetical protein